MERKSLAFVSFGKKLAHHISGDFRKHVKQGRYGRS
jgi:hypothetical protein